MTKLIIQNPKSKIQNPTLSSELWEEAERYLVGGVNSPVRSFRAIERDPVMLEKGAGAFVTDVEGRRYVDLIMGWGALMVGHAHPSVLRVARQRLTNSALLGLTHRAESELARVITEAVPAIEQVRFTVSGTEACMTAVRLARAHTGRSKVLTFEGCYHGHSDGLLVKRGAGLVTLGSARSEGIPEAVVRETVVVPYHDPHALEEAFQQHGDELACAIIEPVAANMGVVVPDPIFLKRLRELATRHQSVLIYDEVVTGFRLAYGSALGSAPHFLGRQSFDCRHFLGSKDRAASVASEEGTGSVGGAQTMFGIVPDLTVLGKIIGGGFPIGAVGGSQALMQRLAPIGDVYHGGTFAGHPLAMAAGLATIRELQRLRPYERLDRLGERLADGLLGAADRAGVPIQVNSVGSMLTVFFSEAPVTTWADARASAQRANTQRFAQFARLLLEAGVLIPPSPYEAMFLSTAHTEKIIDDVIRAADHAFKQLSS
ncbi:MAG: glutamate-1-semialdehyde 2,1-aminomutase [Candidatus Omnitrophica bacterium]|nr:glutamate-1-semialdehyde 2,1-aminomutase [Candidatus Omnitrophota bacterium]